MANNKIGITAEFVSIMREKNDPKNRYFVSSRGRRLYNAARTVFSKKKIHEIFEWRLKLSKEFDKKINMEKPVQIIDLACGYSLRGFTLCLKDSNLVYVDSDLPAVISQKKAILDKMCCNENIIFPKNYVLISADVLRENLFQKFDGYLGSEKKTLITAEGLTSYFSLDEFSIFVRNMSSLLENFSSAEFYSHENIEQPKGFVYKFLREIFVSFLTRSQGRQGFSDEEEFKKYLTGLNTKFTIDTSKEGYLFYSLFKK